MMNELQYFIDKGSRFGPDWRSLFVMRNRETAYDALKDLAHKLASTGSSYVLNHAQGTLKLHSGAVATFRFGDATKCAGYVVQHVYSEGATAEDRERLKTLIRSGDTDVREHLKWTFL